MKTDIYYRDITRTENLEDYLLEKTQGAVENFLKYDANAHLTVRVDTDRHRTDARKPSFQCEVILKPTRSRGVIKVRKSGKNFHAVVAETAEALKKILRRRSSIKAEHNRHDPVLEWEVA